MRRFYPHATSNRDMACPPLPLASSMSPLAATTHAYWESSKSMTSAQLSRVPQASRHAEGSRSHDSRCRTLHERTLDGTIKTSAVEEAMGNSGSTQKRNQVVSYNSF